MPAQATWPGPDLAGLDEALDGPWPRAVELDCTWKGGRARLLMSVATRRGRAPYRRLVGICVSSAATDQALLWISIPQAIGEVRDGARVWVPSPLRVLDRKKKGDSEEIPRRGERAPPRRRARDHGDALRGAALRSGLTLASARHVEAFAVRLPEGEVLPLPGDAFTRVAHLALLLLPFAAMTRPGLFEGDPPFDVDALSGAGFADDLGEGDEKGRRARLARIYPMPGGVRRYKTTLDTWLEWIREARPPVLMFRDAVREHYGSAGHATADEALRFLEITRLASLTGGSIELTRAGEEYSRGPEPERLFERLSSSFAGLLEALVLAATPGLSGASQRKRLLSGLLERRWRTPSQERLRRSWLLSMGLVEREADGDRITAAGLRVLREHEDEVAEIRRRIEDLLEEEREADLAKADAAADIEEDLAGTYTDTGTDAGADTGTDAGADTDTDTGADTGMDAGARSSVEPPSRWSDPVDLTAEKLRPFLHRLRFPDALLHRVCAALSSGKHLLLVGPPGTGKTELAIALGAAARAEGFCRDILPATASADWTTFDTIGGYAIQRAGAVRFRPGIFLRAVERREWLLIDELNRADIDRAFGELMTVLAGRSASTPFVLDDGRLVSIGPDAGCSHRVPPSFRLLATMNTWDRTSLFRLSYAVERRFATVHVGAPDDAAYEAILSDAASAEGSDAPLDPRSMEAMKRLFRGAALLSLRPVGPAIAVDMIRYMRRRSAGGDGFVEAASMILLPQLEGLDPAHATKAYDMLSDAASGWASRAASADLRDRFRDLFPLAKLPER